MSRSRAAIAFPFGAIFWLGWGCSSQEPPTGEPPDGTGSTDAGSEARADGPAPSPEAGTDGGPIVRDASDADGDRGEDGGPIVRDASDADGDHGGPIVRDASDADADRGEDAGVVDPDDTVLVPPVPRGTVLGTVTGY